AAVLERSASPDPHTGGVAGDERLVLAVEVPAEIDWGIRAIHRPGRADECHAVGKLRAAGGDRTGVGVGAVEFELPARDANRMPRSVIEIVEQNMLTAG